MNNKGFMMAEVIVVSAIILVFMTGLYLSYGKLFSLYNTRVNYYDSDTLYGIAYYRDTLIKDDEMNDILSDVKASSNKYSNLFTSNNIDKVNTGDNLFLVYHAKDNLSRIPTASINKTFKDYIDYLKTSATFDSNYIMIMERCYNTDECTYGYLEVYDGNET